MAIWFAFRFGFFSYYKQCCYENLCTYLLAHVCKVLEVIILPGGRVCILEVLIEPNCPSKMYILISNICLSHYLCQLLL